MKERRGNGKEQLRLGESVKKTTVGAEGKPATEKERECAEGKRREGGEKKVCEGGRESENGAGSWCRCAESCSFFPKLDWELHESRASCWNITALSSLPSHFTPGKDVRASPATVQPVRKGREVRGRGFD